MTLLKFLFVIAVFIVSLLYGHAQNAVMTCPPNMIIKADGGKEGAVVSFPTLTGELSEVSYIPASGSFFRLGSHSIIVTNSVGQKCSFTVTVTDNEAPTLSPITLSREKLWPPADKMKKVAVQYDASDNGGNVKTVLSVSSNATDGVKDWEIVDNNLLRLKASRLPGGSARIYTITVTATDDAGNKTTRTTTIAVSETMAAVTAM